MNINRFKILFVAISVFFSSVALAQSDPREVLQASLDSLIEQFTAQRSEFEADKSKLYDFAEQIIDENWDFQKMAQLVLAKNWRRIDDDQKIRFTAAFKDLLVRTYATTMFKYTGREAIQLEAPVYKGKNKNRAIVNGTGTLGDGSEPVPMSFSMFKEKDGSWRIYNVKAAGVSLVITYRNSYGDIIASKGIDSLIDSINAKVKG